MEREGEGEGDHASNMLKGSSFELAKNCDRSFDSSIFFFVPYYLSNHDCRLCMCVGPNRPEPAPTRATGLDMIFAARLDLRFDRPARLYLQGAMVKQDPLHMAQRQEGSVEEFFLEDSAATGIKEESPPEESFLKDNHRAALPEKSF